MEEYDIEKPKEDLGAFNSGIAYTQTLTFIERAIDEAMLKNDFMGWDKLLDMLWMEMYEWFSEKEETEQNEIRNEQKRVASKIKEAIQNKQKSFPTEYSEIFKYRTIMLKKIIHKKGLRMPKIDDERGIPILSRKGKMNSRRY